MIKLYNSLTHKKESLPSPGPEGLRLFVCGPTVYDDAHIGHARTAVFFDMLVRYLRSQEKKIAYIQNITDIDDKIINRAREENKSPFTLAEHFAEKYKKDMEQLGVVSVDKYAPASKFIPQIVDQVLRLKKKGFAYHIPEDGWYFDIKKFKDYGKLSGRTVEQAEDSTSRIDASNKKRNKGDFALWKLVPSAQQKQTDKNMILLNGEPAWNTKLGWGRPGWHIEDTAISEHHFGEQYEIHGGAIDLKFPHHEAEIAQQEAASGKKPFVKLWLHAGLVTVDGEKMGKSKNNFITIKKLLEAYSADTFRMLLLQHHWRSPLDYSKKAMEQAKHALGKLARFRGKLQIVVQSGQSGEDINIDNITNQFYRALEDDFHTPKAISAVFSLFADSTPQKEHATETPKNSGAPEIAWGLSARCAKKMLAFLEDALGTFGIHLPSPDIPKDVQKITKEREECRSSQQFVQADELREKINTLGYTIEDTPLGPFLWPKEM